MYGQDPVTVVFPVKPIGHHMTELAKHFAKAI